MIPHPSTDCQIPWQKRLAEAVRDPAELLNLLALPRSLLPAARRATELFPLRVPRGFVARMTPGDPLDPLLLQVLPHHLELESVAGFVTDPVGDLDAMAVPGLLHKYAGRVLLVTTGACAVHCRYCFRRHYPYAEAGNGPSRWQAALDYIAGQPDIHEVILSGGDPLSLSDDKLAAMVADLDALPRLRRLRIHTRLPVVLPERVDSPLLEWLDATRLQVVMVVHANHPRELDVNVADAMARLQRPGLTLLNQAVLLKDINDDVDTLQALSERLFELGILPYYLHMLDRVSGAGHFEVPPERAQALQRRLRGCLPGYLMPRFVRETAGESAKLPIALS